MAPGARSNFGAPMFEPKIFGSKCTALKKVLGHCWNFSATLAVIRRPNGDSVPG